MAVNGNKLKVLKENINHFNNVQKNPPIPDPKWSISEINRLIEYLISNPALYNHNLRNHYKRTLLEDLWTEIDIELRKPPGLSKEQYVILRTRFREHHKVFKQTKSEPNWPFFQPLKFLIPFIGKRVSKRPKFSELQNINGFNDMDVPRAGNEDSNSSIENAFNASRSPNRQQSEHNGSLAQITILSGQDLDRSTLNPPNQELLQLVDEMDEEEFRSIFSFAPSNILTLPTFAEISQIAPTSDSSAPKKPKLYSVLKKSSSTNSSKREITMLTAKDNDTLMNESFKNGINDVSSQFSCAPTESRMMDFSEFEVQPQSSRIKPEKFKVPIIKKEPGSYVPTVKKSMGDRKTDGPSTSRQSLVKSFCENMRQDAGNVSYSVSESITVNDVQKRKHNSCVCNLDPDAMFMHSMLPEFKNLTKRAKGEFKMKMSKMMYELAYPSNEEVD